MPISKEQAKSLTDLVWSEVTAAQIASGPIWKMTQSKASLWFWDQIDKVKEEGPEWLAGQLVDEVIGMIPVPVVPTLVSLLKDKAVSAAKDYVANKKYAEVDGNFAPGKGNLFEAATDGKQAIDDALKAYESFADHVKEFSELQSKMKPKGVKDYRKLATAFLALRKDACTMRMNSVAAAALATALDERVASITDYFAKNNTTVQQKVAAHAEKNVKLEYRNTWPTTGQVTDLFTFKDVGKGIDDALAVKVKAAGGDKAALEKASTAILGAIYASGWRQGDTKAEILVKKEADTKGAAVAFLLNIKSPDGVAPAKPGTWCKVKV